MAAIRAISPEGRSRGVFIIGCPRSGTSVFSWALAAHPKFWTSAESDYLADLFGRGRLHTGYKQAYERPDKGWLFKNKVRYPEFAAAIGLGIEGLYESRSGGKRWVDATPSYTLMADILGSMFPAAKFLHILRDGRAVVNSMSISGFRAEWASNFTTACEAWAHYATVGRRFQANNPARALEVRFEDLVRDPNAELRRIFEFLGEEHCKKSAELIATKRINSSYGNKEDGDIRKIKDPATAPTEPWRAWSSGQNSAFGKHAGAAMKRFGYNLGA